MSDYPVGIRNGLISGEHRKRMGLAVWEFMWLVDHVTEEYQRPDGEIRGRVLGGSVIDAERIAREMDISPDTVRDNLRKLELAGYITRQRCTNGLRLEVRNSKKWHRPSFCPNPSLPSDSDGQRVGEQEIGRVGDSEIRRLGETSNSPTPQLSDSPVTSKDNAVREDMTEDTLPPPAEEAHTREAEDRWSVAVSVASRNELPATWEALRRCRALRVDENTITVIQPPGTEDWALVHRVLPKLRNALRLDHLRPLDLVLLDPSTIEARAGP